MAPLRPLVVGDLLNDRYKITDRLGIGGFALVYEAFDQHLDREVAIKVLILGHQFEKNNDRESATVRFLREAKAAAKIHHPNVVTIHDIGTFTSANYGKLPFIVMERLWGCDLSEEIKHNGPLAPARALDLVDKALAGLAKAHAQGITHRDLKPSNLFLCHPGTDEEGIRVVDFGIAIAPDHGSRLTSSNSVFGTAAYMAPEYITERAVSPAVDIYQMGLILIEMLTGTPLVSGTAEVCVLKHATRDFEIPDTLERSPLGPLLGKALSKDPRARYTDAAHFQRALAEIDPATLPGFNVSSGHLLPVPQNTDGFALPDTRAHTLPMTRFPVFVGAEPEGKIAQPPTLVESPAVESKETLLLSASGSTSVLSQNTAPRVLDSSPTLTRDSPPRKTPSHDPRATLISGPSPAVRRSGPPHGPGAVRPSVRVPGPNGPGRARQATHAEHMPWSPPATSQAPKNRNQQLGLLLLLGTVVAILLLAAVAVLIVRSGAPKATDISHLPAHVIALEPDPAEAALFQINGDTATPMAPPYTIAFGDGVDQVRLRATLDGYQVRDYVISVGVSSPYRLAPLEKLTSPTAAPNTTP